MTTAIHLIAPVPGDQQSDPGPRCSRNRAEYCWCGVVAVQYVDGLSSHQFTQRKQPTE